MKNNFNKLFKVDKPIMGMIHLSGNNPKEIIKRALDELIIYNEEGVDGAIIEDYHGDMYDVYDTLKEASKLGLDIVLGLNVLRNPYLGLNWAKHLGARFVQFDSVQSNAISLKGHKIRREEFPDILILGGVRFKYTKPTGNSLEEDLEEGKYNCDAIVTTGEGTGIQTPTGKLVQFKDYLKDFPLIVGAGVNIDNVYEQLNIADGAIIGSYFKKNSDTRQLVERDKVKSLMDVVKKIRK